MFNFINKLWEVKHALKMISKLNIEAGINPQIFEAVKKEVNSSFN